MYSILHITDLHRAKSDPITNAELVSALLSDRDCYERETPAIRPPDAIIVSGDIIHGVGLNFSGFEKELKEQYDSAFDFLKELTDRFLDGDRSKVIIVPGNHDVDWNTAFSSMEEVDEEKSPVNFPGALFEPNSPYRWDWKNRKAYKIIDRPLYERRLSAFWEFFSRFYGETGDLLDVTPGADANLYSLDDGRIGVAAFNSCAGNDCFSFHGDIPRECIAKAHLKLKDGGPWMLRIAVWHHDVEGPPRRADYMDLEIIRGMIGRGFRLGLYGHQHRVQITPHHAHLFDQQTMVMASAGSLCAGRRELPTGALRGYSIIEIRDDYAGARIHVREMNIANLFTRASLREFQGKGFVDLEWTAPLDAGGRPEKPAEDRQTSTIIAAEEALRRDRNPKRALDLLSKIDVATSSFGRRLSIDAATALGEAAKIVRIIGTPQSIDELILLVDTHLGAGDHPAAQVALDEYSSSVHLPAPIRLDLESRIKLSSMVKS